MAQITQCRMRLSECILEVAVEADEPFVTVCVCAICVGATTLEEGFSKREKTFDAGSHFWEGVLEFFEAKQHIDDIYLSVEFASGGEEDSVSLQDVPAEWTRCETGQEKVDRQIAILRRKSVEQVRWFRDNMTPLYTWRPNDRRIGPVIAEANRLIAEADRKRLAPQ